MKLCYLELKAAQKVYNDKKEDELILKCIECPCFNKKENGYYCEDQEIRVINFN
jgi:hypothetical protein